jgi:hypothetical protein
MEQIVEKQRATYLFLKDKQRRLREGFPENLALRVHRAISWLSRAEAEQDDFDAAFVFYWIAFNSAYASEISISYFHREKDVFSGFFEHLLLLDKENEIYEVIWGRFSSSIRTLLENQYVFQPFWNFKNRVEGYDDWERSFNASKKRINQALADQDTKLILAILFDRLYVLRNQLMHGGATWNSKVNRGQVGDGARILGFLMPIFINLMMDNSEVPWGKPYYPVIS